MREEIERLNKEAKALRLQDPTRAEELARQAQALAHEIGDRAGLAESWLNLAAVYYQTERYAEGMQAAREALALFTELDDLRGKARALNLVEIGRAHV